MEKIISGTNAESFQYTKKYAYIRNRGMAYIDEGQGDPIVFLHGNPTSSYLWRNIFPYVKISGQIITSDLIGMGDSDKLIDSGPESYTFTEHSFYLYELLEQLDLTNTTLVVHDWGSALGFNWAYLNPGRVKSIVYMEAIVQPIKSWNDWPEVARNIFQAFRSEAGEELVLKNIYL